MIAHLSELNSFDFHASSTSCTISRFADLNFSLFDRKDSSRTGVHQFIRTLTMIKVIIECDLRHQSVKGSRDR